MFKFDKQDEQFDVDSHFSVCVKKKKERCYTEEVEPMKYDQLIEILHDYIAIKTENEHNEMKINNSERGHFETMSKYYYPLPSYAQFEAFEVPSLNVAFAIMKYYDLHNIVENALAGKRTFLMNPREKMDNSAKDMIEFNKIVLYKRLAFITNFISMFVFKENCNRVLKELHYIIEDGRIVADCFYDYNSMQYRDEKICTFFDGHCVRTGKWSVKDVVEKSRRDNTVLFIPQESIYPLNLCLELNKDFEVKVLNTQSYSHVEKYCRNPFANYVSMQIFDAVPGSGKTTSMLKQIVKYDHEYLIIVPTKTEKDELKLKGFEAYTMDSLHHQLQSINKNSRLFAKLQYVEDIYIDECFMLHSGQIRWLLLKIYEIRNYKRVYFYGDKGQVPYYAYVPVLINHSRDIQNIVQDKVEMNVTHRCPQILEKYLQYMYERKVRSESSFKGFYEYKISNVDVIMMRLKVINFEKNTQILTFSQSEKEMLTSQGIKAITIAESQGMTFEQVCLVRMNQYERMIYYSQSHILVALSRITKSFCYMSVIEDLMCEIILQISDQKEMTFNKKQNMNLGEYNVAVDRNWYDHQNNYVEKNDIMSNIINQKKFAIKQNENGVNAYFSNDEVVKSIHNHHESIVNAMQVYMKIYGSMFPHRFLDASEYIEKVHDLKMLLESKGVVFNDAKFFEMFNHSIGNYESDKTLKQCEIGQFKLSEVPRARLDGVDMYSLLNSIYKRNADPGRIRDFMMNLDPAVVIQRFFDVFIDKKKFVDLKNNIDTLNKEYVKEWRSTRTLQQLNKLETEHMNVDKIDFSSYNAFIKTVVKNKVDDTQYDSGQAAQIVAGAKSIMVEYFTPMVKRFSEMLKVCMHDNILINDGVTADYLEWFVNYNIQKRNIDKGSEKAKIVPFEMDYSKFDKNQDWIDLYYQLIIMRAFGISEDILKEWAAVHLITTLKFQAHGITMTTFTQRKSGDAFTFMGNTLFTMLMYSTFYSEMNPICMLFGGDDSLVLFDSEEKNRIIECSDWIAAAFNMEIKYMNTQKSVMFASKFFVFDENGVHVFPDVLKQFLRYNRKIKTKEHAIAQQMSSFILNKQLFYADLPLFDKYFDYLFERYKLTGEIRNCMFMVLVSYLQLVFYGKTYVLYHQFNKVNNATPDEMRKLKFKMSKKIKIEQMQVYTCQNMYEKKFFENYMCDEYVDVQFKDGLKERSYFSINLMYNEGFFRMYEPIMNAIRSYCDKNKISYAHLKTEKEKMNEILNKRYNNNNGNLFTRMVNFVKYIVSSKKKVNIYCSLSERLKELVDVDDYLFHLQIILRIINRQLPVHFKVVLQM